MSSLSLEEKIDVFREELEQIVLNEEDQKLSKAIEESNQDIFKSDQKILKEQEKIRKRYERLLKRDTQRIMAQTNTQCKELLIKTHKQIDSDFEKTIVKKIKQYLTKDIYYSYLRNSLKTLRDDLNRPQTIHLYINPNEKPIFDNLVKEILDSYEIDIKELDDKKIGGFIAHDEKERVSYDFSILNLIEENKELIELSLDKAMAWRVN